MDFKEASDALKEDKKIRRKSWDKSFYLMMDLTDNIKCYREEAVPFVYTVDIINSHDWVIVGEGDDNISFPNIIKPLMEGKKVKLKEWPYDCFLEATQNGKELFMRRICEVNFTPTFECFTNNDWEVINEI